MTLQIEGWGVGVANKALDRWPWPEIDCRTTEVKRVASNTVQSSDEKKYCQLINVKIIYVWPHMFQATFRF
jgi:hypothetical protein